MKTVQTKKKSAPKKKAAPAAIEGAPISVEKVTKKINRALKQAAKMPNEDTFPLAILQRAREIVDKQWCKGFYAASVRPGFYAASVRPGYVVTGRDVDCLLYCEMVESTKATHFCAIGAYQRAQWEILHTHNRVQAEGALKEALATMPVPRGYRALAYPSVPDLNDHALTTKADVLELFDRAINMEKEKIREADARKKAEAQQHKLKV